MFTPDAIAAMQRHAEACYPRESCGLVVWNDYIPRENTHSDPEHHFRVEKKHLVPLLKHDRLQAVVHSHPAPAAPPYPSVGDMRQQISMAVPWAIVPVNGDGRAGEPFVWGDGAVLAPLLGRPYRWGVTDCYSIIKDWYRVNTRIYLPAVAREWGFWTRPDARDLYLARYEQAGFARVDPAEADVGDTVLYRLRESHAVHHASVIIEPGRMLHHPARRPYDPDRLSLREPLSRYQEFVTHVLRPTTAVARL